MTRRLRFLSAASMGVLAPAVWAQGVMSDHASQTVEGVGWSGFTDAAFLLHAAIVLALATALGAALAYHPRTLERVDSLGEVEAPKVYLTYAVVGAMIGLMVVQYGLVVGFVVFGIGGLFRFRTTLESVADTGRLILVALVGLSCGLDLPHLGVLTTAFAFVLIYLLERKVTCQLAVKNLRNDALQDASNAYRTLIEQADGEVIRQNRSFAKKEVSFIFRAANGFDRAALEHQFEQEVPQDLRGTVDWEIH